MFGRKVKIPEVRLPDVNLPSRVDIPEFHLPGVHLGGGRVAGVSIPNVRTPDVRTPELELLLRNGLTVRRKRVNPVWLVLRFVLGVGLGLLVGCIVAALLAPAAGEDTRNRLKGMMPTGGSGDDIGPTMDAEAIRRLPGLAGSVRASLKARFDLALAAFRQQRELKERELTAEFANAKRTGAASL